MVSASSTTQRGSHKNGEAPFTAARRLRCYLVVAQRARLVKRRAAPTARAHPIHLRPEGRSSLGVSGNISRGGCATPSCRGSGASQWYSAPASLGARQERSHRLT